MRAALRVLAAGAVVSLGSIGVGGCTSVRNGLGPREGLCFRALPVAAAAVGRVGAYSGLKTVPAHTFATLLAQQYKGNAHNGPWPPPPLVQANKVAVCLVEYIYKGNTYDPLQVQNGWSPSGDPGPYAVVIVNQRNDSVIATVVLRKQPIAFTDRGLA